MDAIFSRRFTACLFECGASWTRSTFDDGHVNFLEFGQWLQRGDNADLAGELGYTGCETLYYWEHDFIHHWIADRNGNGPSEAIRHGDETIAVRSASLAIRYEEWLVHHIQAWVRHSDTPGDLLALEGWDAEEAMSDLRAQLADFFGPIHAIGSVVRRWSPNNAWGTLSRMRREHYTSWPVAEVPLRPAMYHFEARSWVLERSEESRSMYRMPNFHLPADEYPSMVLGG